MTNFNVKDILKKITAYETKCVFNAARFLKNELFATCHVYDDFKK